MERDNDYNYGRRNSYQYKELDENEIRRIYEVTLNPTEEVPIHEESSNIVHPQCNIDSNESEFLNNIDLLWYDELNDSVHSVSVKSVEEDFIIWKYVDQKINLFDDLKDKEEFKEEFEKEDRFQKAIIELNKQTADIPEIFSSMKNIKSKLIALYLIWIVLLALKLH